MFWIYCDLYLFTLSRLLFNSGNHPAMKFLVLEVSLCIIEQTCFFETCASLWMLLIMNFQTSIFACISEPEVGILVHLFPALALFGLLVHPISCEFFPWIIILSPLSLFNRLHHKRLNVQKFSILKFGVAISLHGQCLLDICFLFLTLMMLWCTWLYSSLPSNVLLLCSTSGQWMHSAILMRGQNDLLCGNQMKVPHQHQMVPVIILLLYIVHLLPWCTKGHSSRCVKCDRVIVLFQLTNYISFGKWFVVLRMSQTWISYFLPMYLRELIYTSYFINFFMIPSCGIANFILFTGGSLPTT